MIFFFRSAIGFDDANQSLTLTRLAHRHDETPSEFELRKQWIRNCWTTGSNEDGVVRSVCGPTECAVKTFHRGVVDSELANSRLGFAREVTDTFNRVNLRCDLRKHRSLVTGARANLQHTTVAVELEQLSHLRHNEGLGDSLIGTNRQRVIAVSTTLQRFGYEEVTRYSPHCIEHFWIVDAVMFA